MAQGVEHPDTDDLTEKQHRERAEFRADLETELSEGAIERLELMDELRESGKLGAMIDSGDFSELPKKLRLDNTDNASS